MSGKTENLIPEKWYSIRQLRNFGINKDFLKKAVVNNDLQTKFFGNTRKTLGMEFLRFSLKLLYGNNTKRAEAACKAAGINNVKNIIVE